MAGIFSNPANWKIVDSIQGQEKTNYSFNNPLSALGGLTQKTYNLGAKIGDPNYDLIPGIDNPFNNVTAVQGASTSGGNENTYDENQWAPEQNDGYYGTGGSGGGSVGYNSEDLAYLDDQMSTYQRLLQSITGSLNTGIQNLDNSATEARNKATAQRERAMRDFSVQRSDMTGSKQQALGRVDDGARQLYDNLRRVLGIASGSGSSAYRYAAPNAVARDASRKRGDVMSTFGRNDRDLTTAEGDAELDYKDVLDSIAQQRRAKEQDLRSGIYGQEQSIQEMLANIAAERARLTGGGYGAARVAQQPYRDRYFQLQDQLDALPGQFTNAVSARDLNVRTPELSDFTVDRTALNANREMGSSDSSPYAQLLKKMRQQDSQF